MQNFKGYRLADNLYLRENVLDTVNVVYPAHAGKEAWTERRESNGAPDLWPYGLNRLGNYGKNVIASDLGVVSHFERIKTVCRGRLPGPGGNTTAIAWDERTGLRMLNSVRADRMYCGVIWATDNLMRRESRLSLMELRRALKTFDGVWCLSTGQVALLRDWLGFRVDQVRYLRFGVDADFFSFSSLPNNRPLIVSFGNDRDRDPKSLYEALDIVLKRIPDAQALVQCDTSMPAPKGVKVIERVSHQRLREIYRRSSLALIATRPNLHASGMTVALEAMATGRPVVVTDTPGMSDYVREGESGHLVPCGDVEGLASAAIAVLDSPGVASEMGSKGRRSVEEMFNTESMAKRINEIIS